MLGLRRRNGQPILPSSLAVAEFVRRIKLLHPGQCFGKPALPGRLTLGNDLVFEFGKSGEKFASFEGLDDEGVGSHPAGFIRLKRLQLADSQ